MALAALGITATTVSNLCDISIQHSAHAIEPIQRSGPAKFKYSLAAYGYRDLLTAPKNKPGTKPQLTLDDFIADCAAFGCEGTELTSYYLPADVTPDQLRALKQRCFQLGLDVSGTAVGNDFGHPPGEKRDKEIASVKQWIERAAILGAPVIRIFAGHLQPNQDAAAVHKLMVAGIEECCEHAGNHGIHLALENHGGPTATAAGLLELVRAVRSPWFGVNLDTGNFHSDDLYGELEQCAPYALNVQVKVMVSGPDNKKVPADYVRLGKILRAANYRGYVALEFEEPGDPRAECRKQLEELRKAIGS